MFSDEKTILSTIKMESKMVNEPPIVEQGKITFDWNFHYVWTITSPYDSIGNKITYIKVGETVVEFGDDEEQTMTGDVMKMQSRYISNYRPLVFDLKVLGQRSAARACAKLS